MIKRKIDDYWEYYCPKGHLTGEIDGHWCDMGEIKILEDKRVICIQHWNGQEPLGYFWDLSQEERDIYYGHYIS